MAATSEKASGLSPGNAAQACKNPHGFSSETLLVSALFGSVSPSSAARWPIWFSREAAGVEGGHPPAHKTGIPRRAAGLRGFARNPV